MVTAIVVVVVLVLAGYGAMICRAIGKAAETIRELDN